MTARPPSSHGSIALIVAECTSCNLCVTECPTWCISLTAHTETRSGTGRDRTVKVLDRFEIDYGLCMYCGICVEVCPFDALAWVPTPVAPARATLEDPAPLVDGMVELAARLPGRSSDHPGIR